MFATLTTLLAQRDIGGFSCLGAFCPVGTGTGSTKTGPEQIERLFTMVFGFLTIVAGLSFLIYFVVGGVSWITAGGDTGSVDKAKKMMTNGLIGLVVVISAYGIIWIVGNILGFNILNPATTINNLNNPNSSGNPGAVPTLVPKLPSHLN